MNKLTLQLAEDRDGFHPRELLRGTAEWHLARPPTAMEVRLCWFVEVQGIAEVRRVRIVRYDRPAASDRRAFEFSLPDAPYSYVGSLASLTWAIELVALPAREFTQVFFRVGPHAVPVELCSQAVS
jgi:hypothetical protein